MSRAATIANLSATATGFADAVVRYLVLIRPDTDPAEIRELLARALEAEVHLRDTIDAIRRLAPNAAREGQDRADAVREGLKL